MRIFRQINTQTLSLTHICGFVVLWDFVLSYSAFFKGFYISL